MTPATSLNSSAVVGDLGRPEKSPAADGPPTWRERLRKIEPQLLFLAAGTAILAWAYWPNFQYLYTIWDNEPNYSHGKLVIPIALLIFWQRSQGETDPWSVGQGRLWGWALLAGCLALRAVAYERSSQWLETATVVPSIACLMLTLGGWSLLKRGWPAVVFLLFMLPLPQAANNWVALPLQRIATLGSVFVMQLTGLWVVAEGNVIVLTASDGTLKPLEVALACNGLSMLMTLAATVTATVIIFPLSNWKRLVVLASAVPIALMSNIIRIVATGWCYYYLQGETAKQRAHDWSGYLMMPLALLLVGLELALLTWLAAEDEADAPDAVERPLFANVHQGKAAKPQGRLPNDEL